MAQDFGKGFSGDGLSGYHVGEDQAPPFAPADLELTGPQKFHDQLIRLPLSQAQALKTILLVQPIDPHLGSEDLLPFPIEALPSESRGKMLGRFDKPRIGKAFLVA